MQFAIRISQIAIRCKRHSENDGHPALGPRLIECTKLVNSVNGRSAQEIFGGTDALKFRSSMTLFAAAAPGPSVFTEALEKYFAGEPDPRTLDLLRHHKQ